MSLKKMLAHDETDIRHAALLTLLARARTSRDPDAVAAANGFPNIAAVVAERRRVAQLLTRGRRAAGGQAPVSVIVPLPARTDVADYALYLRGGAA